MTRSEQSLRHHLRAATARSHDVLDHAMRDEGGWEKAEDYARFLQLQMAARIPVEAWLDAHAPDALRPPPQSPMIAEDLAKLGANPPESAADFAMEDKSEAACLGAAWVLAGSSLGNRSILAELKKRGSPASEWPHAFLGDEAMLAFWKQLRGQIESAASTGTQEAAARGATAVFDHFISNTMRRDAGDEPMALAS